MNLDYTVLHKTQIAFDGWHSEREYLLGHSPATDLSFVHHGNLITSAGVNAIWSLVTGGTSPAPFNNTTCYIAVGSSSTAAASGNTTLGTEIARKLATVAVSGIGLTATVVYGTSDGVGTWREVGILNASSVGTLLNRAVISDVTKNGSNVYSVVITLTLG